MEKKLLSIVKIGLSAALFAPMYVADALYFPFVTGKTAAFRMIVEIVFFFWLLLIYKAPRFRPKLNWLSKAILIFVGALIVSSFLGVSAYNSWFSNFERMGGIFSILHYVAFAFMLASVLENKQAWMDFLLVAITAANLNGLYALGQKFGWGTFHGQLSGDRVSGALGNPTFLASYLVFAFFFALIMFFLDERKSVKWFSGLSSVFLLTMMVASGTRGIMVGLAVAFFFWVAVYFFIGSNKKIRTGSSAALAMLFIIVVFIFANKDTLWVRENYYTNRLISIANYSNDGSVQQRFMIWGSAWKGFKERPLLGFGPENFIYVVNKYFDPNLSGGETWFDSAHNVFFNVLAEEGIVGIVAYLNIFGFAVFYGLRKKNMAGITLAAAYVAYFIQNLFVFDMFASYMMFFLALGLSISMENGFSPNREAEERAAKKTGVKDKRNKERNGNFSDDAKVVFVLVFLALAGIFYGINVRTLYAAYHASQMVKFSYSGAPVAEVEKFFVKALENSGPGRLEIVNKSSDLVIDLAEGGKADRQELISFINYSSKEFDKALKDNPDNARLYFHYAKLLNYTLKIVQDEQYKFKASAELERVIRRGLELSPTRQTFYYVLGEVLFDQGRMDESIAAFQKAIDLKPSLGMSHGNLGLIYFFSGNYEKAKESFDKATELEPENERWREYSLMAEEKKVE